VRKRLSAFSSTEGGVTSALVASERATLAEARLTCIPFGETATGLGLDMSAQRLLVGALIDRPPSAEPAAALAALGKALDAQVADPTSPLLSRSELRLLTDTTRGAAPTADGSIGATRRYLTFEYLAEQCPPSSWADGACEWRGASLARAHTCVIAAGTLSRAPTESERAREASGLESGGSSRPYALWLLNLSEPTPPPAPAAPAAAGLGGGSSAASGGGGGGGTVAVVPSSSSAPRLAAIAASFDLLD
jgi:hypothetical protein